MQTIPFNFDDLYSNAKELLKQTGFDVNEGSNTSQLCAIMAYIASCLNSNTSFNINETLLPFATKRKNILQDARVLGYEPVHKLSYVYTAEITLSDKFIGFGTLTIPKLSYITANGLKYYLWDYTKDVVVNLGSIVVDDNTLNPDLISTKQDELKVLDFNDIDSYSTFYYFSNNVPVLQIPKAKLKSAWNLAKNSFEKTFSLRVTEGNVFKYYSDENENALKRTLRTVQEGENTVVYQYIDIPYTDIEDNGIQCFVDYYDEEGNLNNDVPFTRTEDYFFEDDGNSVLNNHFLRLDDIEMNTPRVYFQYAGMGKGLPSDSVVKFNVLESSGSNGSTNGAKGTLTGPDGEVLGDTRNWRSDVLAESSITMSLERTGRDSESNESIKASASRTFNSSRRLITNLDFQSACSRHPGVKESSVWGGEDEFPRAPGHVWFSLLKPSDSGFSETNSGDCYIRENTELPVSEVDFFNDYETRKEYYSKNYLTSDFVNNDVLKSLKNKFVPGITFHHRQPLFLDFYYKIKLLKYDMRQDEKSFHSLMFKVLDNCFRGNDLTLEKFNTEYFNTNIIKRLDYAISDKCGFESSLETKLVLNERTLVTENWDRRYKDIYVPLCVPFETYFDSFGFLDYTRLPNIDTENFVKFSFETVVKNKTKTFDLLKGDLFTDWSYIQEDQDIRREVMKRSTTSVSYSDSNTRMFMAPVKVRMKYTYKINSSVDKLKLGFMLSPDNTKDQSFNNIQVLVFKNKRTVNRVTKKFDGYSNDLTANYDLLKNIYANSKIKNLDSYIRTSDSEFISVIEPIVSSFNQKIDNNEKPFSDNFFYEQDSRNILRLRTDLVEFDEGDIVEVRFERTCGYYYLFNGNEKKILVHLFVNGDYEGFKVSGSGMTYNDEYDILPKEVYEAWKTHEADIQDDTMFNDITFSDPRSYLVTGDRKYMVTIEPTGKELETEPHYMAYNADGTITEVSRLIRELLKQGKTFDQIFREHPEYLQELEELETQIPEGRDDESNEDVSYGHYLTTEGYLVEDDEDIYSGPKVREYNEAMYLYSPLTTDMFKRNVLLNIKYNSLNFKLRQNVIPRLRKVEFINGTSEY